MRIILITALAVLIHCLAYADGKVIGWPAAASGLSKSDNFNRADQSPLVDGVDTSATPTGTWASSHPTASLAIVSSEVTNPGAGIVGAYWNNDTFDADHSSSIEMVTTNNAVTGPGVRMSQGTNASTGYVVYIEWGDVKLRRYVDGAATNLGGTIATGQSWNSKIIRLEVSGTSTTTLKVFVDDTQIGSDITDSSSPLTSGQPGIMSSGGTVDDWEGAEL